MDHASTELVDSREVWHIWHRKMPDSHYNIVECFHWKDSVLWKIFDDYGKVIGCLIKGHLLDNVFEADPMTKIMFGPTTWDEER